jgi:hypothetical protein
MTAATQAVETAPAPQESAKVTPGDPVTLCIAGIPRVLGIVLRAEGQFVDCHIPEASDHARLRTGSRGVLEFATTEAMWRLPGELATSIDPAMGRCARFLLHDRPQLLAHRDFLRTDLQTEVRFRLPDGGTCRTRSRKLGGRVLLVAMASKLKAGQETAFDLTLPGDIPIAGRCRISRVGEDGRAAAQFTRLSAGAQKAIIRAVFDRACAQHELGSATA